MTDATRGLLLLCALAVRSAFAATCPDAAPADDADSKQLYASLRQAAEASPFFAAAKGKHELTRCEATGDAEAMTVAYSFGEGLTLEVSASPGAGATGRALTLEQPEKQAMALAAREEKAFAAPKGCGIDWKKPVEDEADGDARVKVYRAAQGNCAARVTVRGGKVIKLKLSRAT